jgi:hypothetical protein
MNISRSSTNPQLKHFNLVLNTLGSSLSYTIIHLLHLLTLTNQVPIIILTEARIAMIISIL